MIHHNIKKFFIFLILIICSVVIFKSIYIIENDTYDNLNKNIMNENQNDFKKVINDNRNLNHKYISLAVIKFLAHKNAHAELSQIDLDTLPHEIKIIIEDMIYYNKLNKNNNNVIDIKILGHKISSKIFRISKKSDANKYYDNILSKKVNVLIEYLERTL